MQIAFDPKTKEQPEIIQTAPATSKNIARDHLPLVVRSAVLLLVAALLTVGADGCLATRGWVQDQIDPVTDTLHDTDAKADRALAGLQNLRLDHKLILDDSGQFPTFAFGSAVLSSDAKREITGFVQDLEGGPDNAGLRSARVFLVAGHTDSVGPEDYNYNLGQRRAETVAGYLVSREGVDPLKVRVVSYGASKPIGNNSTIDGRRANRRVEILVYQEKIVSGG